MDNVKIYEQLAKSYILMYKEKKNTEFLIDLFNMIDEGKIVLKAVDKESVGFLEYNKGNGKCCRCPDMILKGMPLFIQNKKGWCISCASDEEKENSFYQNYLRKNSSPKEKAKMIIKDLENDPEWSKGLGEI